MENFWPHFRRHRLESRRINGHYTLIPRVDRISPSIAKVSMCRGWCFHIDQLKLLAVCLDRCYVYNGHFGFEPQRYEEYIQRSQILILNAGACRTRSILERFFWRYNANMTIYIIIPFTFVIFVTALHFVWCVIFFYRKWKSSQKRATQSDTRRSLYKVHRA